RIQNNDAWAKCGAKAGRSLATAECAATRREESSGDSKGGTETRAGRSRTQAGRAEARGPKSRAPQAGRTEARARRRGVSL
ncbi:MAG: hypothetical protein AAF658_11690, partial [Myxococcota bacterium]